jgi:hypothetical protein
MKTTYYLLLFLAWVPGFAQNLSPAFKKHAFVNQTSFGVLMGRSPSYAPDIYYLAKSIYPPTYQQGGYKNVVTLSLQTFNGWRLSEKLAMGITTGADNYQTAIIMPVAAGLRYRLLQKHQQGAKLLAGLDTGWGAPWLNPKDDQRNVNGGFMANPSLQFKFPTKNGSSLLINFGYKYQYMSVIETIAEDEFYKNTTTTNLKRFQVGLGFEW